jgi:uncharacterized protein (DUF488 family)
MSSLYTVGYESTDLKFFIECLVENRITVLIDVRDYPGSRKRGFSKKALAEALKRVDITYEHWRQLGAPKTLRHELRETREWEKYVKGYSEVLDSQEPTLVSLADKTSTELVCLMCFERDHRECHRSLVAERLKHLGLTGDATHLVPKTTSLAFAA